ncbi:hypothetical protein N7519_008131 [Penicillium mononematosum]|uniref:uncharacterized protein n=1 Tax=Penicillium mononematosum TaxID=268346 RepID=UPI0025492E4B|nr:uncharacterized protein N7519_008131 [Penicillium mononematosum]KAJ6177670.1 hypothetical protein N7519_008131 [Penicillium mononematosum]
MKINALPLLFATAASASVQGFDISGYQPKVDFAGAYAAGARFVMIKATEGTSFISSSFSSQYQGATSAGLLRAKYFIAHGGGWSDDGLTLPGMLDIEYNPSGATCYGLSHSAMVSWIKDFGETYKSAAGRYPMIYTTADWWNTCTGGSTAFSQDYPLVLARYSTSVGTIPGGWPFQSFWQNSDAYSFGGDSEIWNGSEASLKTFAKSAA